MDDDNNPYKRRFKTKNEQYQEKLKQRSNSQDWLFGNMFGKPGGGAPLRDNRGNIISHLKTINNDNIFKYDPNYFSMGNNNISVLNNNINTQRNNINNLTLSPNSYQNKQITPFTSRNQSFSFQGNGINNLLLQNNNNQNINTTGVLNQRQIPFGYIIPLQNIIPLNQFNQIQMNNSIQNYPKHMATTPSISNNIKIGTPSINYINKSQNISNENTHNINKQNLEVDNSSNMNNNININESETDNLFMSNDNDKYNKIQNEKKLEEWRNDIKIQMEEQKKKKEDAKRRAAEEDKEEELKYKEFLIYKNKQAEENKKNKTKWKKNRDQQSQNQSNIEVEKSNIDLEQSQQSKINNNIPNIPDDEFEEKPYRQNNPLNLYNITPEMLKEQEKFKNYIDNQYDSLGDVLSLNIQNEVDKLSSQLTKKYESFTNDENLQLYHGSIFNDNTAEKNNKRVEQLHDYMEERDLLDFIIGRDDNTFSTIKYQTYDVSNYNKLSSKMPSFFGKNVKPFENINKKLNSDTHFSYGDYSKNKIEKPDEKLSKENELILKDNERDYNNNYYLNNNINKKFGKNRNDNMISQSLDFSQSLDNKTSFIPLEKEDIKKNKIENKIENIRSINTNNDNNEIKYDKNMNIDINKRINKDIVEENIIKALNDIEQLNKDVILYKIDENKHEKPSNESENNNIIDT